MYKMIVKKKNLKTENGKRGSKYNPNPEWLTKHDHTIHGRYIVNINTGIFHNMDCFETHLMNPVHKIVTNNNLGLYRPCSHCKPDKQYQTLLTDELDEKTKQKIMVK